MRSPVFALSQPTLCHLCLTHFLAGQVGELIGGSQREDRYEVLKQRVEAQGMGLEPYEAYLDIRKWVVGGWELVG